MSYFNGSLISRALSLAILICSNSRSTFSTSLIFLSAINPSISQLRSIRLAGVSLMTKEPMKRKHAGIDARPKDNLQPHEWIPDVK